jgi:hypothetical protein
VELAEHFVHGVDDRLRLILAVEERSQEKALRAARSLVEKYAWSLEARAALRRQGAQDTANKGS